MKKQWIMCLLVTMALFMAGCQNTEQKTARDPDQQPALVLAVEQDDVEMAKALLEAGADPNTHMINQTTSVLVIAVSNQDVEMVKLLIEKGADPIEKQSGNSPIWSAIMTGIDQENPNKIKIFNLLLEAGVDPNVKSRTGTTLLMNAAQYDHDEILDILLKKGVDPNAQDQAGVSALMIAADRGDGRMVQRLLQAGGNPQLQDETGKTAREYAVASHHVEVAEMLLAEMKK